MKKTLGLMAFSSVLSRCDGGGRRARPDQHLRVGLAEDPDVLDPTLARTYVGRIVFASICDKLFDIDEKLNDRAAAGAQPRDLGRRQDASPSSCGPA